MTCNICGKHHASVLVQQIMTNRVKKLYLCRSCAQKYELYSDEQKMNLSFGDIFKHLPFTAEREQTHERQDDCAAMCPECGTSLIQLKENRQLGCPLCFFYFRDTILSMMRAVNENLFYTGEIPERFEMLSSCTISLQHLKEELDRAVENEEYELAAYFRDKIRELGVCS